MTPDAPPAKKPTGGKRGLMPQVKQLVWSQIGTPNMGNPSWYDHVFAETPFGRVMIEWKSWKETDSYTVRTPWEFFGNGYDLDDAKRVAQEEFARIITECLD